LFAPPLIEEKAPLFGLLVGIALYEWCESYLTGRCVDPGGLELRWPNDLLYRGAKLAGILCEAGSSMQGRFIVAGVGLNVNQDGASFPSDLRTPATSLYLLTGAIEPPRRLLPGILAVLDGNLSRLASEGCGWIPSVWLATSRWLGRRVAVRDGVEIVSGEVIGVKEDGALWLRIGGEERVIRTGEVEENPGR